MTAHRAITTPADDGHVRSPGKPSRSRRPPLGAVARTAGSLLILVAAAVVAGLVFDRLRIVILPLLLAVLISPLLVPIARRLERAGVHRTLSALAATAGVVVVAGGTLAAITPLFVAQLDDVIDSAGGGLEDVQEWLANGAVGLGQEEVDAALARVGEELRANAGQIGDRVLSGVTVAFEVVAGLLLGIVLAFFLTRDGEAIWRWVLHRWPAERRPAVDAGARRSWIALGSYLRGVATVAVAEAVMVGAALAIIGVPLALPLAVLTFLGAFIPVLGAFLVGLIATLVALFTAGIEVALLVGVVYVVIQQVESNLLHPVIVGRAVEIHPIALLLAVATGGVLAGIVGALLAGPALVVANAAFLGETDD